jgi:hypothetical protein
MVAQVSFFSYKATNAIMGAFGFIRS